MLLPLSWLKTYLPKLPPPAKLAETLMMHGLEVEEIIDRGGQFDRVIVGEILSIKPHPNADKLRLASVRTVPDGKSQEIVCGAPNIEVGQKVPVALLGANLPNGMTIEKRAIRGVESNGMLCSENELGLSADHGGILVLDPAIPVGTSLAVALGFDDVVLDLAIPANRADLMSIRGLAREIGVILGQAVKLPTVQGSNPGGSLKNDVTVSVANLKHCPVYTARVIRGVKVGPSPAHIQNRLRAAGMRPINSIVDATNIIMLEYGQPLHAFDVATIQHSNIFVRSAKAGEKLTTLDGQVRALDPSMLVIADSDGPVALAGVMGGRHAEVTEGTTDVLLESAIFDPVVVRRTSRKLGLISEASKRFEKGLWRSLPEEASIAAAELIVELAGGTVVKGVAKIAAKPSAPVKISFTPSLVTERLGMKVSPAKNKTILTKLGFSLTGAKTWKVTVPEWRLDVALPEDLIDEVGRVIGFENLPKQFPATSTIPQNLPQNVQIKEDLRSRLVELGFTEVISHAYYGKPWAEKNEKNHFELLNPIDKAQEYLRKSHIQQMLSIVEYAADAGSSAKVFQVGRVFIPERSNVLESQQPWMVSLAISYLHKDQKSPNIIAYADVLLRNYGIDYRAVKTRVKAHSYKGRMIEVMEFLLEEVVEHRNTLSSRFLFQGEFPVVTRDISVIFSNTEEGIEKLHDKAIENIQQTAGKELIQISSTASPFEGKINIVFHLYFQAADRTLTKIEVDQIESNIKAMLNSLGARIT